MIKCPYCNKEMVIDYESDIEAKLWNFNGKSSDVEMILYCENCEEICEAEIHYTMTATKINRISKR